MSAQVPHKLTYAKGTRKPDMENGVIFLVGETERAAGKRQFRRRLRLIRCLPHKYPGR